MRGTLVRYGIVASTLALIAATAAGQEPALKPQVGPAPVGAANRLEAMGIADLPVPLVTPPSEKELAGLPEQAPAELLTWDRVYALALVRARAGGAAVADALDPRVLAEQSRRHGAADFARFRKEFLAGRTDAGGAFHDPGGAYLAILRRFEVIDDARHDVARLDHMTKLLRELIQGEGAGLSQLDVDLTSHALELARRRMHREVAGFRDALDELKVALGLSPHAAVIPDRRIIGAFRQVFDMGEDWLRRPDRSLAELPRIAERLPALGDAVVNGRPILRAIDEDPTQIVQDPARMEELLRDAARAAIKNRPIAGKDRAAGDDIGLELRVRRRIRHLLEIRRGYEDAKRLYVLAIRLQDQAFERLLTPSGGTGLSPRTPVVQGLVDSVERHRQAEDRLATLWTSFRSERLALYRDLGTMPYGNWDVFYAHLSAVPGAAEPAPAAAPAVDVPPRAAPAGPPPPPPAPPTTTAPRSQP